MSNQGREAQQVDELIDPSDQETVVHKVSGPEFEAATGESATEVVASPAEAQGEGSAAAGAKSLLRNVSEGSRRFASAVARAGDAAATKTKEFVDSASDKVDAVAAEGPSALRSTEGEAGASAAAASRTAAIRRTRKARLRISRLDPWSVMKTTLLFSIAFAVVQFIAVWVVWSVIGASGAFDSVNKTISDLVTAPGSEHTFQLQDYVNTHRVLGFTALVGVLDVILITALATLGSFLYNLAATVLGGLEVTLAED